MIYETVHKRYNLFLLRVPVTEGMSGNHYLLWTNSNKQSWISGLYLLVIWYWFDENSQQGHRRVLHLRFNSPLSRKASCSSTSSAYPRIPLRPLHPPKVNVWRHWCPWSGLPRSTKSRGPCTSCPHYPFHNGAFYPRPPFSPEPRLHHPDLPRRYAPRHCLRCSLVHCH